MTASALVRALWRRETAIGWGVTMLGVVVAAAGAAQLAPGLVNSDGPDLTGRLIRRFDLTALGVCCLLASIRIAHRISADHTSAWLDPWMAAGGRRWSYGLALALAVTGSMYLWFAGAAIVFAVGILFAAGSSELILLLPKLLAAGLLVVAGPTLFTGIFAFITREATSGILLAGTVLFLPYVLLLVSYQRTGYVPLLMRRLFLIVPSLYPAETVSRAGIQLIYAATVAAVVARLSAHYAGRRV